MALQATARLLPRAAAQVPRAAVALPLRWRRRLAIVLALAVAFGALYMLWFRDSSLVRVEKVKVVGIAAAPDARGLRAELVKAAKGMTTLHVDEGALLRSVKGEPVVRGIEAQPDFPHGLVITVVENSPVAILSDGSRRVPVAADGTLLEDVDAGSPLPLLHTTSVPAAGRLGAGGTADRVAVAAAAPAPLRARIESITIQPGKGFVAQLRNGPAVWLGGRPRVELKWDSAAAVLAAPSSRGADYIDVRMPERPVAGGLQSDEPAQPGPAAPVPGSVPGAAAPIPADPQEGTAPGASAPPAVARQAAPQPQQNTQP
jgi:cell division protein FtsQ